MTGSAIASPLAAALDPGQLEAVQHGDGPCLVLAGPGSGKTRVIVERFVALVRRGVPAEQQLVLTYTHKAADEMRFRAEHAHGPFSGEPRLTTYHAFAQRVVREWGWLLGISPALRIADAAERWMHVEEILEELRPLNLWNPLRPHELMDPLLRVIGTAKQECVTPERYREWAQQQLATCADPELRVMLERHAEVAEVFARLDARYRRRGVFDHDDCILYAERLIREHPAARRAVAGSIRHVMVDEYQDTNFAQARLVETLVAEHRNLLVVADDDQSIYKFRGASRANLERFAREYPDHRRVTLTHNYRSSEQIVAASRAIIGAASPLARIDKQLVAERGPGDRVEVWQAQDARSEAVAVALECRRLIDSGVRAGGIAWLFRRHVDMQVAMHALRECGVPYQVSGGRGFFQEREIKDIRALLAIAADPLDSQAVLRCLHLPAWQVSGAGRIALAAAASEHDTPLISLLAAPAIDGVGDDDLLAAHRLAADIADLHSMTQRDDVRDVFFAALERSEFLSMLDEQPGPARLQIGANLNKFGDLLESFADWSDDRRVQTALHYLDILRDCRDADELAPIDPIEDGVVLMTAHGAKGLEWPVVFLTRCTERRWAVRGRPAFSLVLPDELVDEPAPQSDAAIDEELRLFYVAATRARDRLVLTWAHRYPRGFGGEEPTRFLHGVTGGPEPAALVTVPAAPTLPSRARRPHGAPLPPQFTVSVSDLRTFRDCPRRFEYRRIWGLPVRTGVNGWYGTLVHDVLRDAGVRVRSGVQVTADDVAALWHRAWDTSRGPKGLRPELRALGEEQLRRYVAAPAWTCAAIAATEERFSLPMRDDVRLVGRFDRIDTSGTVVDYKTGRPHTEESLRRDLQVRAYAVAVAQRLGAHDAAVELHYLQTGAVTRIEIDRRSLDTAHKQLSAVTAELAAAWRNGEFEPKPSPWQCPRCEYRTVCAEGRESAAEA